MRITIKGHKTPKYQLGQKVWKISDQKAEENIITGLMYDDVGRVLYRAEKKMPDSWSSSMYCHDKEENLFETKEALIASL